MITVFIHEQLQLNTNVNLLTFSSIITML